MTKLFVGNEKIKLNETSLIPNKIFGWVASNAGDHSGTDVTLQINPDLNVNIKINGNIVSLINKYVEDVYQEADHRKVLALAEEVVALKDYVTNAPKHEVKPSGEITGFHQMEILSNNKRYVDMFNEIHGRIEVEIWHMIEDRMDLINSLIPQFGHDGGIYSIRLENHITLRYSDCKLVSVVKE